MNSNKKISFVFVVLRAPRHGHDLKLKSSLTVYLHPDSLSAFLGQFQMHLHYAITRTARVVHVCSVCSVCSVRTTDWHISFRLGNNPVTNITIKCGTIRFCYENRTTLRMSRTCARTETVECGTCGTYTWYLCGTYAQGEWQSSVHIH